MEPSKGSHLALEGFAKRIIPLCSPPGFRSRIKKMRYETLPMGSSKGTSTGFASTPKESMLRHLRRGWRLVRGWGQGNHVKTLEEWKMAREAGYPKPIPYPNFGEEDFETI